ncbi:hypothetical protein Pcinc_033922 [Petrolisthes cinctipes]|uniref:Uncharacterized protein n=1 Tax=Petrolisthes cinctipes TaxID=88211 RepID=A0AAE1ER78_PETCI|nr:hypothetical protein Pcinc_033922 [Petrolisthes cinctipes]
MKFRKLAGVILERDLFWEFRVASWGNFLAETEVATLHHWGGLRGCVCLNFLHHSTDILLPGTDYRGSTTAAR